MSTHFLDICSPVSKSDDGYHCMLDLRKYIGSVKINPIFLLLEGINQAAARTGRMLIEETLLKAGMVLPAKVIAFDCLEDVELDTYAVKASATIYGEMVRVFAEVSKKNDPLNKVAKAEIAVALAGK